MSSPPPTSPPPMVWPPSGTVVPFPLPWGQTGCCPPGGMDALMKCYCDIQAASAFICKVMVDCINNNPAVTQAIIAAIEASGSSLPLIGVTNGSDAQPGQVGEHILFNMPAVSFPATQANQQILSMGVIPPGDWDCWAYLYTTVAVDGIEYGLSQTAGFSNQMVAFMGNLTPLGGSNLSLTTPVARLSAAVPTLVAMLLGTWSTNAGVADVSFEARRVR